MRASSAPTFGNRPKLGRVRAGTHVPAFTERFHKLLAKSQNALRGRWENLWASEQVCVIHLVEPADVMHKLVYVATNPVKDRLVEKVHHWPGVNGLAALLAGHTLEATRPRHFFRPAGPMPAVVTVAFALPPGRVRIFCDSENLIDSASLVSEALSGSIASG